MTLPGSGIRGPGSVNLWRAAAIVVLLCTAAACARAEGGAHGEWRTYGGDPGGTRFSPLDRITTDNVASLARAWTHHVGEPERLPNISPDREPPGFQATPLMAGDLLYLVTPSSRLLALDPETGERQWEFDPQAGRETRGYHQHRGLAYWEAAGSEEAGPARRLFYGTLDAELICLDAVTGAPCVGFGRDGRVNLRAGAADRWPDALYAMTSPPLVFEDLVIAGARLPESPSHGPSGMIRAFDVRSGRLVWTFHTVPRPSDPGSETWAGESWRDRTGVNVWAIMSLDEERGLLFAPLGAPAYDFYGGDRHGENLFGSSLVALDARTGRRVWHYQMVHHDIWDYDLPAQPILVTLRRDGREVPAVVQLTKMGLVFVLERETGQPIFPVEQRPVPPSVVPGEAAWPTQPFPRQPPPLVRHVITADDLSTVTPESAAYCRTLFDSLQGRGGRIYTPIGLDPTLIVPGTLGGANWSGGSVDPAAGRLFVNVNERPLTIALGPDERGAKNGMMRVRHYQTFADPQGRPCVAPPWGLLHAVDLHEGTMAWSVPLGSDDELEALGVPRTGLASLGGSIATAGGLVFVGGTTDSRFRAFDARTGQERWTADLEAPGHATPITYLGPRSGRQFVVIAAGGGGYISPQNVSDALVAFALP